MINIKSIIKNLFANSFLVLINIIFQLISVPIFIKFWGIGLYGEWIVLSAISVYFSMTDVGLNTVTANDFSINYAKGKYDTCKILLNNNLFFLLTVFSIIFFLLAILISCFDLQSLFHFKILTERIAEIGLALLTVKIFIGMIANIFNTIYRANHLFSRGVMIDNTVLIAENTLLIGGVMLNLPIIYILCLYLIPVIIGFLFKISDTRRYIKIDFNIKYFDKKEFYRIILPGISFLSMPIGNAVITQGFTIMVSFVFGNTSVVLFNTMRTLVNFVKTGLTQINNSIWPELSLAFGRNDFYSMKKILRYAVSTSFYLAIAASTFLLLFGKPIYELWTGSVIIFNYTLFILFLLNLITNSIWYTNSVVLFATNNHKTYALLYMISTIVSLGIGYFIVKVFHNISFLPISLFIIDIFSINIVIKESLKIIDDTLPEFYRSVFLYPIQFVKLKFKSHV